MAAKQWQSQLWQWPISIKHSCVTIGPVTTRLLAVLPSRWVHHSPAQPYNLHPPLHVLTHAYMAVMLHDSQVTSQPYSLVVVGKFSGVLQSPFNPTSRVRTLCLVWVGERAIRCVRCMESGLVT